MKKDIEVKKLAEYMMSTPDGECGVHTIIFPRWVYDEEDNEVRVSKKMALELSGMEEDHCETMGAVQKDDPVVRSTGFVWIVEQTYRANV